MSENITNSFLHPTEFILVGFSGIEDTQKWLSIPFFIMYITAITGNTITLSVIITEQSLHQPMYIFISMLAAVDILLVISTLTKLLGILWFNAKAIIFEACVMQMFLIHCLTALNSTLLVIMSFDRYIAVCHPFIYPSVVTGKFIAAAGILALVRSVGFILPLPFFVVSFPYCATNTLSHCYCEYFAIANIFCADIAVSTAYIQSLFFLLTMPDNFLVGLSYIMILRVILKMKTKEARQKAISTSSSHFLVVVIFHVFAILSYLLYSSPPYLRILASVLFIVIPSTLNPFIYSFRMKEIRLRITKLFHLWAFATVTK
ncbi:olfactory receptor 52E8-like [Protopterus annectens]|uniref:olfactory receptor 52E8-like n=1 Tax=Protopterus annectens TaxID=7888 RepID=UPI001CFB259C|nr:olfactory receptor 52E8-like [Protopterus annectens]